MMKLLLDLSICEAEQAFNDLRLYLIAERKSQGLSASEIYIHKKLYVSSLEDKGRGTLKMLLAMLDLYGLGLSIKSRDGLWPRRIPLQGLEVLGVMVKSCRGSTSINALAKRIGVGRGTIEFIEAGKAYPRILTLFLIAKEFGWVLKVEPINREL